MAPEGAVRFINLNPNAFFKSPEASSPLVWRGVGGEVVNNKISIETSLRNNSFVKYFIAFLSLIKNTGFFQLVLIYSFLKTRALLPVHFLAEANNFVTFVFKEQFCHVPTFWYAIEIQKAFCTFYIPASLH